MLLQWLVYMLMLSGGLGDIHVGAALNIFDNFGDLGSVVKVNHPHEDPWLLDHYSTDVFQQVVETRRPFLTPEGENFNGEFLLQLCDDSSQLKAALYRGHKVEGIKKSWRAFTGGWSNSMAARYLGINSSYLVGTHGYALVRLNRHHEWVTLSPDYEPQFNQWVTDGERRIVPEDPGTVLEFIKTFGSHYINSYVSGDSLYQVFVFAPSVYKNLQKAMKMYELSGHGLEQVLDFFTPWHVEHIGRIVALSGNSSVELWAEQNLRSRMLVFIYSSLLNLHSSPELLEIIDHLLGNEALLSADLKSLAPFFKDERRQLWFKEILDNHMKLWEISV